jgi:hypothetical protein
MIVSPRTPLFRAKTAKNMPLGKTSSLRKFLTIPLGVGFSAALLFGFFGVQIVRSEISPSLSVSGVSDGEHTTKNTVTLIGKALRSEHLFINGKETPTSPDGTFETTLALSSGFHMITLSSEDKHGKQTTLQFALTKSKDIESPTLSVVPYQPENL